mmetsp:Transcript_10473/g.15311  ORF Transcript_10473/g.15311 Transcript_10473/m.15311 type:complete len:242 (+) Transcript_10473:50-775(+)
MMNHGINANNIYSQDDNPLKDIKKPHSMGTTIMAIKINGGVIVAADSRTSTGAYIANRVSQKLTPIHDRVYVCRSGSAADTQAISDYVKYYTAIHSMENSSLVKPKEETLPLVSTVATLFQRFCYEYRNNLMAGIIVAGWDQEKGGSVYNIPLGGAKIEVPYTSGGSGSVFIYGYCDRNYKENMSVEEGKKFISEAISLAMARDGSSGGIIRMAVITKEGINHSTFTPHGQQNRLPAFHED